MLWELWVIIFVLLATLATLLATSRGQPSSPEDVLKDRLARGEIDCNEYERRLRDLRR